MARISRHGVGSASFASISGNNRETSSAELNSRKFLSSVETSWKDNFVSSDQSQFMYTTESIVRQRFGRNLKQRSFNYAVVDDSNLPSTPTIPHGNLKNLNKASSQDEDGSKFTTHKYIYTYTTTTARPNKYVPYTATPISANVYNKSALAAERERIRAEFFATYDVMTGVRIAATLGGFFGLMVFLIVWKSRSSSNETIKVLKDPKMAAVAAVCMQEEEEREIQEAMVATGMSIYPDEYDAIIYRRQRMLSLGNVSAPPMLNRGYRFSSVGGGGYSSLLEPPRRFSFSAHSRTSSNASASYIENRRKSTSETSRIFTNYPMGSSFVADGYFMETDDDDDDDEELREHVSSPKKDTIDIYATAKDKKRGENGLLKVPLAGSDSRRSSAMTCCSTNSSYLERRTSAFKLGMRNLPPSLQRKPSSASHASSTDNWDYYYPDIQVIEPTPKTSPHASKLSLDELRKSEKRIPLQGTTNKMSPPTKTAQVIVSSGASTAATSTAAAKGPPCKFIVPKHHIAFYDVKSTKSEPQPAIHSVSVDKVNIQPYNTILVEGNTCEEVPTLIHSAPPTSDGNSFQFIDATKPQLPFKAQHKKFIEYANSLASEKDSSTPSMYTLAYETDNNLHKVTRNSSSISVDSTPLSIERLNDSDSLGTMSARLILNGERRAPLASLSSFKISSLECQDSEMISPIDDSVFLDSIADTEEDVQELSSELSETHSLDNCYPQMDKVEQNYRLSDRSFEIPYESRMRISLPTTTTTDSTIINICNKTTTASAIDRRSLLQRHRTITSQSDDDLMPISLGNSENHPSSLSWGKTVAPFGAEFVTKTSQKQLQAYSCADSLQGEDPSADAKPKISTSRTLLGGVELSKASDSLPMITGSTEISDRTSASLTQHSSQITVVSFDCMSPSTVQYQYTDPSSTLEAAGKSRQQLPYFQLIHDTSLFTVSDLCLHVRHPIVTSMPSSFESVVLPASSSAHCLVLSPSARYSTTSLPLIATNTQQPKVNDSYMNDGSRSPVDVSATIEMDNIHDSISDHTLSKSKSRSSDNEPNEANLLCHSDHRCSKDTLF